MIQKQNETIDDSINTTIEFPLIVARRKYDSSYVLDSEYKSSVKFTLMLSPRAIDDRSVMGVYSTNPLFNTAPLVLKVIGKTLGYYENVDIEKIFSMPKELERQGLTALTDEERSIVKDCYEKKLIELSSK